MRNTRPRAFGFTTAASSLLSLGLLGLTASVAGAHEFWLDPVDFTPKTGATVPILQRNGLNFLGDSFPFIRALSKRFVVVDAKGERPVKAVEGDDPVAEIRFTAPGLNIVVYQRAPEQVVYATMAEFEFNLQYEGLDTILAEHRRLARPEAKIREQYSRHNKSLISVGAGASGNDRPVGLPIEIVAERNPYTPGTEPTLPVRVLVDGKPIAGVLVKCFNLADPASPRMARTDAEGRAVLPLVAKGEYLLNAVHMRAPVTAKEKADADWVSLWASTTFKRP